MKISLFALSSQPPWLKPQQVSRQCFSVEKQTRAGPGRLPWLSAPSIADNEDMGDDTSLEQWAELAEAKGSVQTCIRRLIGEEEGGQPHKPWLTKRSSARHRWFSPHSHFHGICTQLPSGHFSHTKTSWQTTNCKEYYNLTLIAHCRSLTLSWLRALTRDTPSPLRHPPGLAGA